MKLETSITFTPYTIDTYGMFTLECEDALLDDGKEYDDYEWTYKHKEYVQALADNWGALMNENILDGVIKGVTVNGEAYSPREYNFTTDNATVEFDVDIDALRSYVDAHRTQYEAQKLCSRDGFMWFGNDDDTMLEWYLRTVSTTLYSVDNYIYDQRDRVADYEYVECTLKA